MNYTTTSGAEARLTTARLGQLYKLPDDAAQLEADLSRAEAEVDSHVGKRYETPVVNTTAEVLLADLSYDLWEERAWRRAQGAELPKKVVDAAKNARDFLKLVAKGEATLAGATSLTESDSAGAGAIVLSGNEPQWDRDNAGGY